MYAIDAWRIENSLGDLYGDAVGSLAGHKLHDVRNEARIIWLPLSFAVVLLAVVFRIRRDRPGTETEPPGEEEPHDQ
jgi:hypothetical protein